MFNNFFTFSRFVLFIALCISAIAAYYSVIGLTAIFAGAVIPIIVMGAILEIAKITTTVWLHKYWDRASWTVKTYLTSAVIALACLTSMGIFGLLSKAHSDTGLVSGDVSAKIALIDEKIKTQRDNIEIARRALQQMDEQVNQRMSRSDSEQAAERSIQIRRQQSAERTKLQKEIGEAQTIIAKLNEERAPIAASQRKVEAEVGPIKYIAALIYGDNPDTNLLERAVRWVTIMIVIVFDPLAIILILAANNSLKWEREEKGASVEVSTDTTQSVDIDVSIIEKELKSKNSDDFNLEDYPYLFKTPVARHPPGVEPAGPQVFKTDSESVTETKNADSINENDTVTDFSQSHYETKYTLQPTVIQSSIEDVQTIEDDEVNDTIEKPKFTESQRYVNYQGKLTSISALRGIRPDLIFSEKTLSEPIINFGNNFPKEAFADEYYIRIDTIPHRVYQFDSKKWVSLNKHDSSIYLQSKSYIRYLVTSIENSEYNVDLLTDRERDEISTFLKNN